MEQRGYYAVVPAKVRYDKELSPNAKLLYGEITALSNERGYCWAGNSYFSELYGKNKSTIARWIKQLEDKGHITREVIYKEGSKEIEARYMRICDDPIGKNATTPIGKNAIDNTTSSNTTKNNSELPSGFEEFWNAYPKKTDKKAAISKFKTAVKEHSFEEVLSGTKGYVEHIKKENTEKKYIKHAKTFLNQQSYLDFIEQPDYQEEISEEFIVADALRDIKESIGLGRAYYERKNNLSRYEELLREKDRLEQLRAN